MGENPSSPPEREMKNFQFRQMKKIRIFESPKELPKDRVNLLTLSNNYGLVFMGGNTGLKILGSQYVSLADKTEGSINTIIEDAPFMSVNMKLPVHHIALNCDDFTLSVAMSSEEYGLVIAFFDVRTFVNKDKQQKRPFVYYKPETKCTVTDLKWNPTVPSILAVCQSDGSLTILEVTDIIKQHASLPPTSGITSCRYCLCYTRYPLLRGTKFVEVKATELIVARCGTVTFEFQDNFACIYFVGSSQIFPISPRPSVLYKTALWPFKQPLQVYATLDLLVFSPIILSRACVPLFNRKHMYSFGSIFRCNALTNPCCPPPHPLLSLSLSRPSVPASTAEVVTQVPTSQIKPGPPKGLPATGPTATGPALSESSSSSTSSFIFTPSTGGPMRGPLKTDLAAAGTPGDQVHKISSFPGASTGFHFTSPNTSSLNALSNYTQGIPASTKDTIRTNLGLSNKPALEMGASVPFSSKSPKSSTSSASAAESAAPVCLPNASCTELQPAGKPRATGVPPAIPATASKAEDQQSKPETQPTKPDVRTSIAEIHPPKAEAPPQPKPEAPLQAEPEIGLFQGSAGGVTIGSFSGLVVSQTDDVSKLERSSQDSFIFTQTDKTSTAPPATFPFGSAYPTGKADSTEVTTAVSVDTGAPKLTGASFSSVSMTTTEISSSSSSLQSTDSKLDFVSRLEQPDSATQIAAAIAAAAAHQGPSLAGSLSSLTSITADAAIVSDAKKLPTSEGKEGVSDSSSSIPSEKQVVPPGSSILQSRGSVEQTGTMSVPPDSAAIHASLAIPSPDSSVPGLVVISPSISTASAGSLPAALVSPLSTSSSTPQSSKDSTPLLFGAAPPEPPPEPPSEHPPEPPSELPFEPSLASPFTSQPSSTIASPFGQPVDTSATSIPSLGEGSSSVGSLPKPTFGQPSSVGFGQPSSSGFNFRQPTFGSTSSYVQPTSAAPQMPSSSPFSGPTSTGNASAFSFGQSPGSSAVMFGQPSAPAFGQNTGFGQTPAFGTSTVTSSGFSFGQPSNFGGTSVGSVFGPSSNTSSVFGQPGSTATVFGSANTGFFSGLGRKPSVDAGSKNPFGQINFGSADSSSAPNLFGNSGAKTFGFGSAAFGADQKSSGAFSAGSSVAAQGFGNFSTPTKAPGGFGAAPMFGSPPAFGATPTFGGLPAFGGAPAFGGSISPSGGKVFGEGTAAASAGGFGFGNSAQAFGSVTNQPSAAAFGSVTQQPPGFGTPGSSFSSFGSSGGGFGSGFGSTNQSSQSFASGWRG
ncbi:nuclear pore complex protein Nup214-like [Heterodontus francisci]|uniref:nuclear pore complex protein Nup214-like n=1 Tax=Heterodontus francisci TaxID=7792 RepID=UPI00355C177B